MGFKRGGTVYKLVWPEGDDNHGMEARMRGLSVAELMQLGKLGDLDLTGAGGQPTADAMAALDGILELFASKLVSWNLEDDDDQPVPTTLEGVRAQDLDFVMEMIDAWMTAAAGVAPPLSQNSTGGETFPVESLPMEPLSGSLAS